MDWPERMLTRAVHKCVLPVLCSAVKAARVSSSSLAPNSESVVHGEVGRTAPTVTFWSIHGRDIISRIRPTPKANVEKLKGALSPLLSFPLDRMSDDRSLASQWTLTQHGSAIYRVLDIDSKQVEAEIISEIERVGNKMNHHADVIHYTAERQDAAQKLCIICTTHRPAGLGMRDVRLATTIDGILKRHDVHEQAAQLSEDEASHLGDMVALTVETAVRRASMPHETKCSPQSAS